MKVSVASKYQKVSAICVLGIFLIMAILFVENDVTTILDNAQTDTSKPLMYLQIIVELAIIVICTATLCVILASNVVIDENGITLRRGAIKVRHFSWEEIKRVEAFKIFYRRKYALVHDTFVSVLTTHEESAAFQYRMPPNNLGRSNISFAYDEQALALIRQYCKGEIVSANFD